MKDDVTPQGQPSIPSLTKLAELTPRTLVLDMLAVAADTALTSVALAQGGDIMGFKAGAIRVAVSRLSTQGAIISPQRGSWQLAENAPWAREQGRWRGLSELLCPWRENWWVAVTHQVSRSNRSGWREHERALRQRGFAEVQRDLFVRPANLSLAFSALRQELRALGMAPQTVLLRADQLSVTPRPGLWDFRRRHTLLEKVRDEMCRLLDQAPAGTAPDKVLCARFLRVGRAATKILNTDPLLPEEWTGPSPRGEVIRLLPHFISTGRTLWFRYMGIE